MPLSLNYAANIRLIFYKPNYFEFIFLIDFNEV